MASAPQTSKILIGIIIALVVIVLGWVVYSMLKNEGGPTIGTTVPTPSSALTPSGSPNLSPSPKSSVSSSPQMTPSSNASLYKVPAGETYIVSAQDDTNGDNQKETLVVTSETNGKYHAYVLSSEGAILYDNKELGLKPLRITTTKYNADDKNVSWMLVFTEESGSLAIIRWNGQTYEMPQDNLGI